MCLDEKPSNLVENWGKKPDKSIDKKSLNLDRIFEEENQWLLLKHVDEKSSHLVKNWGGKLMLCIKELI